MKRLMSLLLFAASCGGPPIEVDESSRPMMGGTILSASEVARAGVVVVFTPAGQCSGSILRTSKMRSETWVMTAAHCFGGGGGPAQLWTRAAGGTFLGTSDLVVPHPGFSQSGGRNSQDIALIHFPFAIFIGTPSGVPIANWFRPIFGHDPQDLDPSDDLIQIFGGGCQTANPCVNDGSIRYLQEDYSSISDENIEDDDTDGANDPMGGDSGGPWMTAFGTTATTNDLLDDGVIIGVHTGEYLYDNYASSTFGTSNLGFVLDTVGDNAVVVESNQWERPCFVDWCHYRDAERAALIGTLYGS